MRERDIEAHFRERIERIGGLTYKMVPVVAGIPDRLVLLPGGTAIFVELKTKTGVLAPIQKYRHRQLEAIGFHVYTLYGKEQVDAWIDLLG